MNILQNFDRRDWLMAGVAAVALLGALTLFVVPAAPAPEPQKKPSPSAQPKITWSEKELEAILSPGETASRGISFISSLDLQNVVLEPVPEIAPFLTLTPNSLTIVPASAGQPVEVNFLIPEDAPLGDYEGTVHVRVGEQTLPQTLKVLVRVWHLVETDLGFTIKYPPGWTAASNPTTGTLRIESYSSSADETEALGSGEVFIEVFTVPLSGNNNYQARISDTESLSLAGIAAMRGFRTVAEVSPFPGYDMYVPVGDLLYVVAGSYDGSSAAALQRIKLIQTSFRPF